MSGTVFCECPRTRPYVKVIEIEAATQRFHVGVIQNDAKVDVTPVITDE